MFKEYLHFLTGRYDGYLELLSPKPANRNLNKLFLISVKFYVLKKSDLGIVKYNGGKEVVEK